MGPYIRQVFSKSLIVMGLVFGLQPPTREDDYD